MYIVISGGGKIGEYLAMRMLDKGNEVAIIEQDQETADRLSSLLTGRYLIIHGDGCIPGFQEDANIRRADVFVATTGQDDNNLMACEIANRAFGVPRCIARVNSPKNIRIFRHVGIECVSSTALIASIIEEDAMLGGIRVLTSLSRGNVALTELSMPRMKHHDNDEGVRVTDVGLPEGCLIVAVSHDNDDDTEVAGPDTVIMPGDVVTVASDTDKVGEAMDILKQL